MRRLCMYARITVPGKCKAIEEFEVSARTSGIFELRIVKSICPLLECSFRGEFADGLSSDGVIEPFVVTASSNRGSRQP